MITQTQPFRFYPSERRLLKQKEDLSPSQWAEKYRQVPIGAHKGSWRNSITPHAAHIMDNYALPYVREIVIVASPQTGKTECQYNCAAYMMDREPSTMMFIMPTDQDARKVSQDRIIPMFEQSPRLRELMSSNPDDTTHRHIKLNNGGIIYMACSNSASALASFPIKYSFFDETDKYPAFVGKESDPITLGEKRNRTFKTYKRFKVSTPTREDGVIWKAFNRADVIFKYEAKCPQCSQSQIMKVTQIKLPLDENGKYQYKEIQHINKFTEEIKYKRAELHPDKLAYYECEHCQARWNDTQRDKAVRAGRWVRTTGESVERPKILGYHLPSWLSSDVSLSEIAAAYLITKTDKAKLIDFYNDYCAEPFIESEEGESASEEVLYNRREVYAPISSTWNIPMNGVVLTCGADIQKNRIECEIKAWGEGFESWGIEYKVFPGDPLQDQVWTDFDNYINRTWTHESGNQLKIAGVGIDTGYLKTDAYRFIRPRQVNRVYAFKGIGKFGRPLVTKPISTNKGKGKSQGIWLWTIGVDAGKDTIYGRLNIDEPGARYMHFPMSYHYEYFKGLCAEQAVNDKKDGRYVRVYKLKHDGQSNEPLDVNVYNLAVIEILNPDFKMLALNLRPKEKKEPQITPHKVKFNARNKSFINGWR